MFDVLIIGGGPAGLSAAIYCGRKMLKTGVVAIEVGGQINAAFSVENYPGIETISGFDLMQNFSGQAEKFGVQFIDGKVVKVEKQEGGFKVFVADEVLESKALILAFGKTPKTLGVPGEDKYLGRGVSVCTTCDAAMFPNKTVAVVGGGNSAFEGVLELSKFAKKVFVIHRNEEFRADAVTVEKVKAISKVEFLLNSAVTEVFGDKFLKEVEVQNLKTSEKKKMQLDGLFLEIGFIVDSSIVKGIVDLNAKNEIVINGLNETSCQGIFAAGDATSIPFKQVAVASGEGVKAALQCYSFLTGGKSTGMDWGHKK